MLEFLNDLDVRLFVAVNQWHHPFWDQVMVALSNKFFWIPFYAGLLVFLWYQFRRRVFPLLGAIGLTIALANTISSEILKPWVARLRPCHDAALTQIIYLADGCGGKYGFMSSHAANSFGLAVMLALVLNRQYNWLKALLFFWAVVISYSRVYLGAHYPGDVLAGGILGGFSAWAAYLIWRVIHRRFYPDPAAR